MKVSQVKGSIESLIKLLANVTCVNKKYNNNKKHEITLIITIKYNTILVKTWEHKFGQRWLSSMQLES